MTVPLVIAAVDSLNGMTFGATAKARPGPIVSSDFVTDTFTEASATTLASHTGELGATWTVHPAAAYTGTATVDEIGDRVYPANTVTAYYASGVPPSADYYVQGDIYVMSVTSNNSAICARMDTTANTMYLIRLNNGTTWELRKIVAGTATTLRTSTNQLPSAGQSATIKLVVSGSTITGYVNGVEEMTAITDTDISAAGRAGVRFATGDSASTGYHIDNFSAR